MTSSAPAGQTTDPKASQRSGSASIVADLARGHEEAQREAFRAGGRVQPVIQSAFRAPDQASTPLFRPQVRSPAVSLQAGRSNPEDLLFNALGGQPLNHPGEDTREVAQSHSRPGRPHPSGT